MKLYKHLLYVGDIGLYVGDVGAMVGINTCPIRVAFNSQYRGDVVDFGDVGDACIGAKRSLEKSKGN